jgi:hypothetical protein
MKLIAKITHVISMLGSRRLIIADESSKSVSLPQNQSTALRVKFQA